MVKLKFKKNKAEAAGFCISNETRFSFVDVEDAQVISPVSCRTFIAEVLWSFLGKGKCPRTDYNGEVLDTTQTKMSITFKGKKEKDSFIKRIEELNALEIKWALKPTVYEEVENDEYTFLIKGDIAWQKVWGITLYTCLLKRFTYATDAKMISPEDIYVPKFLENEEKFMTAIATPKQEENYQKSASAVHSDGFVQLSYEKKDHINGWIFQ
jgi:hypothetical protein